MGFLNLSVLEFLLFQIETLTLYCISLLITMSIAQKLLNFHLVLTSRLPCQSLVFLMHYKLQ